MSIDKNNALPLSVIFPVKKTKKKVIGFIEGAISKYQFQKGVAGNNSTTESGVGFSIDCRGCDPSVYIRIDVAFVSDKKGLRG